MNRYLVGGVVGVALVIILIFALGVFEEANDGPLENAAEAVKDVVD